MATSLEKRGGQLAPGELPRVGVPGLYVHVPFCFHKCHYCDFYSITRQSAERMSRYVDLILREAERWSGGEGTGARVKGRTVFFGGGTPTLLPLVEMRRMILGLKERLDLSAVGEWTVEGNPATVTLPYCQMLREVGVDRMSFGAQSFDEGELKTLERHHVPEEVGRSLEMARGAGFSRLNLDLIFGIPGQDLASWEKSLEEGIGMGVRHLSCYGLTYEANTAMAVKRRLGQVRAVEEEVELAMLHHARKRLREAGMEAYEISNYAAAGEECRHNLVYWKGEDYIGLGPAAASHVRGWRWRNRPHLGEWERAIEAGELAACEVEVLSEEKRARELVMLMLRLREGVEFAEFAARTGFEARGMFAEQIGRLAQVGVIEVDEVGFRLTERGVDVGDSVVGEFL